MNTDHDTARTEGRDPLLARQYERLGGSGVPADAADRVAARIRTRRRHRRVVGGVAAAAAVAGLATVGVVSLDPGDEGVPVATDPTDGPAPASTLTVGLPDGTEHVFDDVSVSCDAADVPGGAYSGPGSRIWAWSTPAPDAEDDVEGGLAVPYFYLELRVDEVADGETLTVPVDDDRASERQRAVLFVAADTGGPRVNEVSSAISDASGRLVVRSASCDGTPSLAIDVDATLSSEVDQESLPLRGSLS